MKCPTCSTVWEHNSEQAIAVELFGSCISCTRHTITKTKLDKIMAERTKRLAKFKTNGGV